MQHRLGTLFLLLSLFALSANRAWACGSDNAEHAEKFHQESSKKSCCSEGEAQTPCADDSGHQHSDTDCPCDHDNGSCHCPGCGTTCHASAAFAPANVAVSSPFANSASMQRQAFYFAEHLPEAVYLPIWQPPKLVA
ncbi:MAG: hypothetical protein ACKVUS_01170 [Saprospiraceae bacterium]